MSDTPKPYREPMEYEIKASPEVNAAYALISIANSLAILADETEEISPIVHAGFIAAEGASADDGIDELSEVPPRKNGGPS